MHKPGDLSLIPGLRVEGENLFLQICAMAHVSTCFHKYIIQTHTITVMNFKSCVF